MDAVKILHIEARTHGRVLVRETSAPRGALVGFHGYSESAEIQMARLESIPGCEAWTLVSVQGLHRFYRGRSQEVGASWMTRQDREAAIADNIEYVNRVFHRLGAGKAPVVCAGFSQGGAMAFRAGLHSAGIISVGGDIPPELAADASTEFPERILLARGAEDDWYTDARLRADINTLTSRGRTPEVLIYQAGHDWTAEVSAAAGRFLASCVSAP
jgi:predicted esterase